MNVSSLFFYKSAKQVQIDDIFDQINTPGAYSRTNTRDLSPIVLLFIEGILPLNQNLTTGFVFSIFI